MHAEGNVLAGFVVTQIDDIVFHCLRLPQYGLLPRRHAHNKNFHKNVNELH